MWKTQELANLAFSRLLKTASLYAGIGQTETALKIANSSIPDEESFRQVYRNLGNDEITINWLFTPWSFIHVP